MLQHDDEAGASDVVRRVYAAVEAGEFAALRALLAPDLEWRQAGSEVPAAGSERVGAEELIHDVLDQLGRDWVGFSEEVDRMIDAGDTVVVTGTYLATHRGTGRELEAEFCHIWTVRDGRAVGFRQYTDTAAFAAAADAVGA